MARFLLSGGLLSGLGTSLAQMRGEAAQKFGSQGRGGGREPRPSPDGKHGPSPRAARTAANGCHPRGEGPGAQRRRSRSGVRVIREAQISFRNFIKNLT